MATTAYKDLDSLTRAAQWLKFLSSAHVIPVISYIHANPNVSSLTIQGEIARSNSMRSSISNVMKFLSLRELVEIRKDGASRLYSLTPKGVRIVEALENVGRIDL
jgi:predicted transcriptional regulator